MSIASEISRIQTAKADLKTAIENKGVTVPSSTKLDGYADLVDSIEQGGGGGTAPYIVNPLSGTIFGSSDRGGGTYTHQYQLSSGNIVDAYLAKNSFYHYSDPSSVRDSDQLVDENKHIKSISASFYPLHLEINNSGLLTLTLESAINRWEPANGPIIFVILISDEGYTFIDDFDMYCTYPCFVKGTKITLSNGEKKTVDDITYDDELLVWNFDEGKYDSAKPLWIKKVQTTTWYYKLKFSNGLELKVTGTYPEAHSLFSVEDGKFIHANKLVGKKVYTLDGIATLESCKEVHENVEFYNIITNYHMNLFANNILTSTSLNNLYPIKDMKFVKEDRKPAFDVSMFNSKWVNGLRLDKQQENVTEYVNNLIRLQQ